MNPFGQGGELPICIILQNSGHCTMVLQGLGNGVSNKLANMISG